MKKLLNVLLVMCCFTLTSCYKTKVVSQMDFDMDENEKETLMQQCDEMSSYGDVMQILHEIKSETNEVLQLLSTEDMRMNEKRVSALVDSINKKSYLVIALSRSEWVDQRWNFEAKWSIDKNDFKDVLGVHVGQFKITKAQLQKVFFHGEQREDLLQNVSITEGDNQIVINYKNRGSSLELCQLHKTLMILVDVNYKNITNKNHRYFNLTLDY
jgi:hypothetical protein